MRRLTNKQLFVEAHRYVDQGHKKGNVVITVEQNSSPHQSAVVDGGEF